MLLIDADAETRAAAEGGTEADGVLGREPDTAPIKT